MKTLILGGTGLLGPYLQDAFAADGPAMVVGRTKGPHRVDILDKDAMAALIQAEQPDTVINAVALTDVDACERDPERADALNRGPAAALAEILAPRACLVHLSTDQVYPGNAGPYEEDRTDPINVYGRTKLAGELAASTHQNSLVLRVNFFGRSRTAGRFSLSDWLTQSAREGRAITLFSDSLFSPLRMETLAGITRNLVADGIRGTYNLGSRDGASKAWFARRLAAALNLPLTNATEGVSADLPGRAPRPKDMRMDVAKLETAAGLELPTLAQEIDAHAAEEQGEAR